MGIQTEGFRKNNITMAKKKPINHTTIRNGNLFCTHCGGQFVLVLPMKADDVVKKTDSFNKLHADCPPTWKEPEPDQSKTVNEKALWWIANGRVGMSSKTMWLKFMGQPVGYPNHPHDPDDFSRCYKLLEAVPEWKEKIPKLKELSPQWSNLADNWVKLTQMYESKADNGHEMYDFMQVLLEV